MSYDAYARRIAKEARDAADAAHAVKVAAAERRAAKRRELQPQYDEAVRLQREDLAAGVDLSEAIRRLDVRLADLNAQLSEGT